MSGQLEYDEKTVAWLDPDLQQGFTQVPNAVLRDPRIPWQARMTYVMLVSFAWQGEECWPGQEKVAGLLGVSERHVRTQLQALQRLGLVQVRRRGLTQSNVYRLLPALPPDRNQSSAQDRNTTSDE